jgi:magnesium transporter
VPWTLLTESLLGAMTDQIDQTDAQSVTNHRGRISKRRRRRKLNRPAPASIPGTFSIAPDAPRPVIHVTHYGPSHCDEKTVDAVDQIRPFLSTQGVTWINVDGLGDKATLKTVSEIFDLHLLTLADIANVHQRPKVEVFDHYLYFVTRMRSNEYPLESEQVSIVLGSTWVLSVQEHVGDCFDSVRSRIRLGKGRARRHGADYLAYLLVDAVVDQYFPILDQLSEQIDQLEDDVLFRPTPDVITRVHDVRRDLLGIRRAIWPQRDAINLLLRDELPQVRNETRIYFRDVYDHCVQLIDMIETYRELAQGLMDVYLSVMSNRMNEIMKVLTIIATIFIPLTFVAGIYGMNFDPEVSPWNMPELKWYYGYPAAMLLMTAIAMAMLGYFIKQGWLFGRRTR